MAAFGLELVDAEDSGGAREFYLWPENWVVWCAWRDLETQLCGYGMDGGAPGLDYGAVQIIVGQRVRRKERKTVFWLIQAMEEAVLEELRDRSARDAERAGGR